jgi:hypothetical protein
MRNPQATTGQTNEEAGMKDSKRTDLHPPVLPSWGSMLPPSPPSGYGNIEFRKIDVSAVASDGPQTDLDEKALAELSEIFRRDKR